VLTLVILGITFAIAFDFMNGVNDAANSVATVVATRVLKPLWAVVWAAFFNFVAVFVFGVKVAATIGKGIVEPHGVTVVVILAALLGATIWSIVTTHFGLPISVSHALIGGLLGAGLVYAGPSVVIWKSIVVIAIFMAVAPLLGMVLGAAFMWIVTWMVWQVDRRRVSSWFRRLQLVSAALYSLGHGTGDAQKTMGVIAVLLATAGYTAAGTTWLTRTSFDRSGFVPDWAVLLSGAVIALGTMIGGWRVVKTLGVRMSHLLPMDGFCAESAAAASILGSTLFGIPVSTTHTITGAIVGVGAIKRLTAVRWGVTTRIVWAWIFTLPASAAVAALIYLLLRVLIPEG